jgi:hypothetical protein
MRLFRLRLLWMIVFCATALFAQQPAHQPLVRSWTIREIGSYKKIPTATLRAKMAQRGVLFAVNEPYSQDKVDGTALLLRQLYKDAGVLVTVRPSKIPVSANAVKVEYVVNRQ